MFTKSRVKDENNKNNKINNLQRRSEDAIGERVKLLIFGLLYSALFCFVLFGIHRLDVRARYPSNMHVQIDTDR